MTVYVFGEVGGEVFDLWPYAAAVLITAVAVLAWRMRRPSYVLCWLVFGVYLLTVVNLTLFPLYITTYTDAGWTWEQLCLRL